ncbi:MAG: hypothetical protein OXT01_08090 [Rhodospirillaceae bacterium]|nr:hypothetical protein [Rhodospirillaceae bacterium]
MSAAIPNDPASRRAARLADGYYPATGDTSFDVAGAVQALRKETQAAGRDPDAIEVMAGCPDCLPGSGKDPLKAIADRAAAGVARVVLPVNAFAADLEGMLAEFGAKVIAPSSG